MALKKTNKFTIKQLVLLSLIVIVALAPLLFRKGSTIKPKKGVRRVNVITSHNETIRREYGEAFTEYWKEKTGENIYVNWITPGGGGEVRKVIDTKFSIAQRLEKKNGGAVSSGLDVFFGGGAYEFNKAKKNGYLAELEVFNKHPEYFESGLPHIPQSRKGETFYDIDKQWVGVCLSRFGICYNTDVLKRLNIPEPTSWDDLANPKYFKNIAVADPTKSGSVAKAFEMMLQQKIQARQKTIKRQSAETITQMNERALRKGWEDGLKLIQKIAANGRYFSDDASKIPHDVAQGDSAAGLCIDFYGRAYEEKLRKADGTSRIKWIIPSHGTSTSVDPVAVFKNAPDPELAQAFVSFLLSDKGQMIWNAKVGTELGPKYKALRRLPIRKDIYTAAYLKDFSDPDDLPYQSDLDLSYNSELTGPLFNAMRMIIRVMAIDPHEEMKDAWQVLADHDFPKNATEVHFHDLSMISYEKAMQDFRVRLNSDKVKKIHLENMYNQLCGIFRSNYNRSAKLAIEESSNKEDQDK